MTRASILAAIKKLDDEGADVLDAPRKKLVDELMQSSVDIISGRTTMEEENEI
jgi:biotin operon repressor